LKRIAKYLGIAAILLALLIGVGGFLVNRWLQSAAAHAALEGKLSDALRRPVKVGKIAFSAWNGITATDVRVSGPDGALFEAAGISASHRFSSLLHGGVTLNEVRIRQPRFVLTEDASGKWGFAPGTAPLQSTAIATPPEPGPAVTASQKKPGESFIGKIIIEGGSAEFISKTHTPYATVTGLEMTLREMTADAFSADFNIAKATLHGQFSVGHIHGLATRAGDRFQIRNLAAEAGGGSLIGEAAWTENSTGSLALQCDLVDLARATQDAGAGAKKISGMLRGSIELAGLGAAEKAVTGKGAFTLSRGNCAQFEVLRQIGEVLRVASLANFEIADATATFQIADGQTILAPVEVSAPFDGALNLTASLHAPSDLVARHPVIAPQFSPPDANSRRSVPFNITGTFSKPRQNLAEKLTGTKDRKQQRIIAAEAIISALMDRKNPQPRQPAAVQPALAQP
jgi:hypothetical protein